MKHLFRAMLLCVLLATPCLAGQWDSLVDRLAAEGLNRGYVTVLFERSMVDYDPTVMARKMDALTETHMRRLAGEKAPVPHEERAELYDQYTQPDLMQTAWEYMDSRGPIFDSIEKRFGVPREVMVALLQVETKLGTLPGKIRVFINLASMANSTNPDMFRQAMTQEVPASESEWLATYTGKKADWAFKELAALIRYARANRHDPLNILGSKYGAIGYCQFMPTSAEAYGVDGNGDGVVDLFTERDSIASMANYLVKHGWMGTMTPEKRYKAVYAYNHSKHYTNAILAVAAELEKLRR
ncbi:MAG: lytic murein transglycosylase [Proteobacteria bacterium]|nr:lytic murein transglycosylase [Pseudomonadota bacterium]MBU1611653.1 lytic murein transglycosylase [Pseudomonadota bacterium]